LLQFTCFAFVVVSSANASAKLKAIFTLVVAAVSYVPILSLVVVAFSIFLSVLFSFHVSLRCHFVIMRDLQK